MKLPSFITILSLILIKDDMIGSSRNGFTLIELLVVITVIGALAAIGIPQFISYRVSGYNAAARSDLKNAIAAQEAAFGDRNVFWDCMNSGCNDPALPGMRVTGGVSIACTPREDGQLFQCSARHNNGNVTYYYDSEDSVQWQR